MESKVCFYTKRNTTSNVKSNNYLGTTGSKCGRWNPTSEQVKVLTELFRSGLRTPTTDQIQNISTQLSFYGKIENKNVFYWFQNHKARERHKRLKVSFHHKDQIVHHHDKMISSTTSHVVEVNSEQISSAERVIDTLQLFPLSSFEEAERFNCRESATAKFSYTINATEMPIDLRLSFI